MTHFSWGFLILSTFVCWLQQHVGQVQIPQELSDWASAPLSHMNHLNPSRRSQTASNPMSKKKKKKTISCFLQKHLVRQAAAAFLLLESDRFTGHPLWTSLLLIRLSLFICGNRYKLSSGTYAQHAPAKYSLHTYPQTSHNKLSAHRFKVQ